MSNLLLFSSDQTSESDLHACFTNLSELGCWLAGEEWGEANFENAIILKVCGITRCPYPLSAVYLLDYQIFLILCAFITCDMFE